MQTVVTALDPDSAAYQGALGDVLHLLGPGMSAVINVAFRLLLLMCFFEARPQRGLIRAEESPLPLAEEGACVAAVAHAGAWAALVAGTNPFSKNQLHMLKYCAVVHLVEVSPCLA